MVLLRNRLVIAKMHQRFIPSGLTGVVLAQDIMTSSSVMVDVNINIAEAARVMIRNRISGLRVINKKGYLVGIITKTDILKVIQQLILSCLVDNSGFH